MYYILVRYKFTKYSWICIFTETSDRSRTANQYMSCKWIIYIVTHIPTLTEHAYGKYYTLLHITHIVFSFLEKEADIFILSSKVTVCLQFKSTHTTKKVSDFVCKLTVNLYQLSTRWDLLYGIFERGYVKILDERDIIVLMSRFAIGYKCKHVIQVISPWTLRVLNFLIFTLTLQFL